jgi:serine/threonine-protein kinase
MDAIMLPTTSTSGNDELTELIKTRLRVVVTGYRLTNILGRGGQATVYRAIDQARGNAVAIKLLHGGSLADLSAQRRFHDEISALKALNHPNIVCFIASGQTADGHDYLVMNYVDVMVSTNSGRRTPPQHPKWIALNG